MACPNALKGVLSALAAATALADGMRRVPGIRAEELPVADGGDGSGEVLGGEPRQATVAGPLGRAVDATWWLLGDGTAVVEAAEAIGLRLLAEDERDPLRASSRGLGELIATALEKRPRPLLVCLGGTATVDGGAGLREVVRVLPVPTRVACDVRAPLLGPHGAARAYGPQKGASIEVVELLEARLAAMSELAPYADQPGAGAAGGLGAALAALGAELVDGAALVLETLRFRDRIRGAALVVTGEGVVDATTAAGKAPAAVAQVCAAESVRCVVFGGRVEAPLPGVETRALSGRPEVAEDDLVALGEELARRLA